MVSVKQELHNLWYRKVYSRYHCENCIRLLLKAIFLISKKPFVNKMLFSGLEIGAGFVKFALAEDASGQRKIVKLIVKKLPAPSAKEIAPSLKGIADEVKGRIGNLTLVIPRHKVTVRFLGFPSLEEKEITAMVRLQSTKQLPFPKEEIISDYLITGQTKDGYTKVALVIVHRDVVNGYLDILNAASLQPERITFSVEASLNWFRSVFGLKNLPGSSVLIDLDNDNIDFSIFNNSNLVFTRGLTFGIAQLQNNPDFKNRLVQELRRTIESYMRQQGSEKVQRLFLTHAAVTEDQLKSHLEREFNLPTEAVSPLANLTDQKEILSANCKDELSLLRVLGAVLKIQGRELNLLPVDLRKKQELKTRTKQIKRISLLSLCIILLSIGIFVKTIYNKRVRLLYLNKEIESIAQVSRNVENMVRAIELIEDRRRIAGSVVDVLRELHLLTPQNISFSSFDYDEEEQAAVLQGTSVEMSGIVNFPSILKKSPYFKNVQLKYVSEKKAKAGGYIDFRIECNLER